MVIKRIVDTIILLYHKLITYLNMNQTIYNLIITSQFLKGLIFIFFGLRLRPLITTNRTLPYCKANSRIK